MLPAIYITQKSYIMPKVISLIYYILSNTFMCANDVIVQYLQFTNYIVFHN